VVIDLSSKGLATAFDPGVHTSALKLLETATDPVINAGADPKTKKLTRADLSHAD